ncbi:AAA family ATPase [Azospirillum sp. YIM B02556]|uniref:AAA family ATPase n=1 Tax=Azospirillum endophyticum TaxID=2800326 RepID=A0ABS1F345_9PROT|nr:AAA family ATPase [Azospirillum endophyticum]MBK1837837.1 AAA family ATPase [Azospirillum endophyticum]
MMSPFIRHVAIRNYKSIAACRLNLGPLTFLVGPNGAGKSNFLDALRFVADALRSSLDHALRDRGTIKEVRRRSGGHPNHFALRFGFELPNGQTGHYAFRVGAKPAGAYEVQDEECFIHALDALGPSHYFRVQSGKLVESSVTPMPAVIADRLYLVSASGIPEFRPVYDALSSIEVYNLNPREIAAMQRPDPGDLLRRDGSNAASVLHQLSPNVREAIRDNLSRIVPGIADAEAKTLGSQETIEFRQIVRGQPHPWRFLAGAMSDGTLRAFGILLAVFQAASSRAGNNPPLLIGLEEPEVALHPAAAGVLLSALREGARHCQIIVTSHSPDLLDNPDIPIDSLLAVENHEGLTCIGPIDEASKQMLRDHLFTPGELLRQRQLSPDREALEDISDERQLKLFNIVGR